MKTNERLERIETNLEKLTQANGATQANLDKLSQANGTTQANLDKLSQVMATIAASVVAHDDQIEKLLQAIAIGQQEWAQLRREFQAYLTTIHPRQ